MALRTRLTERLGIRHPILSAPMGNTAGGALAAAVSAAGGLGLIGGGRGHPEFFQPQLIAAGNQRVGCGFITWCLAQQPESLDIALAHAPAAMMFSFGDCRPFIPKVKQAGIPLICQIQTVAMAREVLDLGADIIIAQGAEAGGHGVTRGTLPLVPAVVDLVAASGSDALVLAAGGIIDGRGLAAALMLGADGVLMGTRFHASEESLISAETKAQIVAGSGDRTIRSHVFDIGRDAGWPSAFTGRTLANRFSDTWHGREAELAGDEEAKTVLRQAIAAEDFDDALVWAGEGIDLIHEVEPAGVIVERTVSEAEVALARRFG